MTCEDSLVLSRISLSISCRLAGKIADRLTNACYRCRPVNTEVKTIEDGPGFGPNTEIRVEETVKHSAEKSMVCEHARCAHREPFRDNAEFR